MRSNKMVAPSLILIYIPEEMVNGVIMTSMCYSVGVFSYILY